MSIHGGGRMLHRLADAQDLDGVQLPSGLLRRVLRYGRPYVKLIVAFLVCILVGSAVGVVPPLLFKVIIDDGVLAGDAQLVVQVALLVGLLAVVNAAITVVQRWCSARIGEGLIYDLRTEVFDHVQRMPISFFSRTDTGKLVSRLQSDVVGAQRAFTTTLSSVVSNVVSLVLVLVAMIALSWQLTLASIVLLPIFLLPARRVGARLSALTRDSMTLNAELSSTIAERFSVSGALLVQLFGRPTDEHERFAGVAAGVRDNGVRIAMVQRVFMTALGLVAALATALVYGLGGVFSVDGALTVGTLTALVGLLAQLYGPLTQLSNVRVDVMSGLVSFDRVFEILDVAPMISDAPNALPVTGTSTVEFRGVDFTYPGDEATLDSLEPANAHEQASNQQVLFDVSFAVPAGATYALVGPSGSGKTTITHLVARLYDATAGAVFIGGTDVRSLQLASLRGFVGYVTQDAHLFHDTIRANLAYAKPDASAADMWRVLDAAHIAELVRRLPDGLDTMVGERGYRLSGGERARLAIARLMLKAPAIVVLDEATAHLDTSSEEAVQRALDALMADRTTLVIAHRLSTVRDADQILVVDQGRISARGTHAELLDAGGLYARLYEAQFSE